MRQFLGLALVTQLIIATTVRADEASLCAESEINMSLNYYECLEFLEMRLLDLYPAIAERSESTLILIASNSSNRSVGDPYRAYESYYLVAHFPKFALSMVIQSGQEWSTRHIFNHSNGQFLEVIGWPAFSDNGERIAFFGGNIANEAGILGIYSFQSRFIKPMAIFHTQFTWFSDVTFRGNNELISTANCRVFEDGHWILAGQSEEMSFQYDGNIWRPGRLKKCTRRSP